MITAKSRFKNFLKEKKEMPSLQIWKSWGYCEKYFYEVRKQVIKETSEEAKQNEYL